MEQDRHGRLHEHVAEHRPRLAALGAEETIILPVLARDEEPEPSTQESMFSYIRLSDGGTPRHVGPRSEVEIIADLAQRVLVRTPQRPADTDRLKAMSRIRARSGRRSRRSCRGSSRSPTIDKHEEGVFDPRPGDRQTAFPTADGKAHLFVHDLPAVPEGLQLMTIRSEGQFNTVVYEEEDLYRNQTRRDIVLMHPDDIARLGLTAGGRCRITSAAGEMRGQIVSAFDQIRPGNVAMYYPESNVLVPKSADPLSRTPAYKSIAVTVTVEPDVAFVQFRKAGAPEARRRRHAPRQDECQCG
jgi:anaerobic selenocysteine-containing dehydrogenase